MAEQKIKQRPNRLVSRIIRSTNVRSKKDIQQWRTALMQAENVDEPKRILLYNLYNEMLLDAHLSAEIERRLNALMGSDFSLYDKDGEAQVDATKLIQRNWFKNLVKYAWQSILWGHSLMEIETLTEEGKINSLRLINRLHVIPEKGIVTLKQGDSKGINYREDKKYASWLFEVGSHYDLGLLNKCVPHVLFKRFSQSAYSEYCEVLGIPPRVLKTDAYDEEHLNRSEDMVAGMGVSNYAVIGKNEEIEFVATPSSDGSVFTNLFKISSAEISKLIGGAVIGEDTQNGSRSKEQVSLELTRSTQEADKLFIEEFVNEQVLPRLLTLGYPVGDLVFRYTKDKNLDSLWEITSGLLQFKEVDNDFITQTFGIPVSDKKYPQDGGFNAHKKEEDNFFG